MADVLPPIPRDIGKTRAGREDLLAWWLAAEEWAADYARRLGAYLEARGHKPDERSRAATQALMRLQDPLRDARMTVDVALRDARATGECDDDCPRDAAELLRRALRDPPAGLGLGPAALIVIAAIAGVVVLGTLAAVLIQVRGIIEEAPELPALEDVSGAAWSVTPVLMALGALAALWLWRSRGEA